MLEIAHSSLKLVKPATRAFLRYIRPNPPDDLTTAQVLCQCDWFGLQGSVTFTGRADPDDATAWWKIGFVQLKTANFDRAYYQGINKSDGSIMAFRDRPPAFPIGPTRDTGTPNQLFSADTVPPELDSMKSYYYDRAGTHSMQHPSSIREHAGNLKDRTKLVSWSDDPRTLYNAVAFNDITNKLCLLRWLRTERSYVAVLIVQSPNGSVYELQHVQWSVHWEAHFTSLDALGNPHFAPKIDLRNTRVAFGPILKGPPTDPRFSALVTSPFGPTSTSVSQHARDYPILKSSLNW